ncbi:MAG: lactate dehydrogenase-like 2-hydroxyacid dehydrogenase [Candidatus Latescibacterota bacterium]|jgi:lactate dehydrogenase-like 2-hydroxyacid dehydrogenase
MPSKILVTGNLQNPQFDSPQRREALAKLSNYADEVAYYSDPVFTAKHAEGVVAVLANSVLFTPEYYAAAKDLKIIARWGVGFDQVNVEVATEHDVLVTVSPVHMVAVAEYAITQWLATLKRVYTLNQNSHSGNFQTIRTFEAKDSTLGIWGMGRIGQTMAERARALLGENGRLLVYDTRPDIAEVAAQFNAEVVDHPRVLFEESDTISLHLSGDDTVVTYDLLCAMKPHASLINPSRGNLVDDQAVNRAIKEDRLYYYVVDDPVNGPREIHKDHPRIICTNHNAGITVESAILLDLCCVDQIIDTLEGRQPNHILNPDVLESPRVRSFWNA